MRTWAAAALVMTTSVAGCASPGPLDGSVPTAFMRSGSCHRLSEPAELYTPSDVAPPVPCASPHQSETLALVKLPDTVARLPERPERAPVVAAGACVAHDYRHLREYLGADDLDRQWGVDVWLKVPTRQEWSQGLRVGRCDVVLGHAARGALPTISHRLRGALRRVDSALIRHCRDELDEVTCDRPHTAEEVGGWTGLIGTGYPGARAVARALHDQCWRNAQQYTGGAFDGDSARATVDPLTRDDWLAGRRTSACWITMRGEKTVRGTLRAGLTKEGAL